jgi:hypothetical protein
VRAVAISGFAELASKFFSKSFSPPPRAIAFDELSGTRKSMAFSRVITDADRQIQVEGAYCYGMGRFQCVVYG